jgi:serine/threonine protein kinase
MIMGQAYDHTIDIWALGVLAYEFVCGMEPFAGDDARRESIQDTTDQIPNPASAGSI